MTDTAVFAAAYARFVNEFAGRIYSELDEVNAFSAYLHNAGGKHTRAQVALALGLSLDGDVEELLRIASVIECIHIATLVHDDIIDDAQIRRGKPCAHIVWGNAHTVLAGDFLYSRAVQMLTQTNNLQLVRYVADCTNVITEGEIDQLLHMQEQTPSMDKYWSIIHKKTARLFQATCYSAVAVANAPASIFKHAEQLGYHLGMAFQIVDDLLDYLPDTDTGKTAGQDLREGKKTLPWLIGYHQGTPQQQRLLQDSLQQPDALVTCTALFTSQQVFDQCRVYAQQHIDAALVELDYFPLGSRRAIVETMLQKQVTRIT